MHCVVVLGKVHAMNDRPRQKTRRKEDDDLAIGARDELRLRVLRALEANPKLSQRQLAVELGVSLGGVNYALRALIGRGFVKAGNFVRSDKKAAYLYTLTPSGLAEKSALAAAFLSRKLEEYDVLTQEIEDLKKELDSNLGAGAR
jgi:EPS-associated MarR family transcriptional regulator